MQQHLNAESAGLTTLESEATRGASAGRFEGQGELNDAEFAASRVEPQTWFEDCAGDAQILDGKAIEALETDNGRAQWPAWCLVVARIPRALLWVPVDLWNLRSVSLAAWVFSNRIHEVRR